MDVVVDVNRMMRWDETGARDAAGDDFPDDGAVEAREGRPGEGGVRGDV